MPTKKAARHFLLTYLASVFLLVGLAFGGSAAAENDGRQEHRHAAVSQPESAEAGQARLRELLAGNQRFAEGKSISRTDFSVRRKELAAAQKPKAVVLSCSDSRVPPEYVFDQGLGDIFVVRTAGAIIDTAGIASIEYAVTHLNIKLLVVLAHESCGAIKSVVHTSEDHSPGSPAINALVQEIKENIDGIVLSPDDKILREPAEANASAVIRKLKNSSTVIKDAVEKKELLIVEAFYELTSGRVR